MGLHRPKYVQHSTAHDYNATASVFGPLLCVAESLGLDVSILVCCLAVFSLVVPSSLAFQGVISCPPGCHLLPARMSSLALQGALQDGFCNGVVLSDVAKPGELCFTDANKGSCFPTRESTCCLTYSLFCRVFFKLW